MFRLIKLAIYAAAGYLLYEFVRGMMGETQGGGSGSGSGGGGGGGGGGGQQQGGESNYRQRAEIGGGQNLMGGQNPQGMTVATQDPDGASMTERVGRGVIPRV